MLSYTRLTFYEEFSVFWLRFFPQFCLNLPPGSGFRKPIECGSTVTIGAGIVDPIDYFSGFRSPKPCCFRYGFLEQYFDAKLGTGIFLVPVIASCGLAAQVEKSVCLLKNFEL
jgi:hypothetical protein